MAEHPSGDLRLEQLSKRFESFTAVHSLDLTIPEGSFFALLGPSGCGKTTTLRMVAGFEIPSAGTISIAGEDVTNVPVNRRDIGFVFQNYALFPHMSVFENVAYGLRVKGLSEADIRMKVGDGLELVGLGKAEVGANRRQRDVDDRDVEHGHQDAEADDAEGQPAGGGGR